MMKIPVLKPLLPSNSQLIKYLEEIDQNRWYTNFGPLTQRFEKRLASLFMVEPTNVVTISNGTDALAIGLKSFNCNSRKKYCIMPSWTFSATPSAAMMAGLEPIFCDVEKTNWTVNSELVYKTIKELNLNIDEIHSVIPVAPFGMPLNVKEWESFRSKTGIEVLIDAAASFDTVSQQENLKDSVIPVMISLHATKVFGVGEGAVLVSSDQAYILEVRKRTNFGFWGSREAQVCGMNAKLSEYTSAVGLAELDRWHEKRHAWELCTKSYLFHEEELNKNGINFIHGFGQGWISSYGNIILKSEELKTVVSNNLKKNGVDFRDWWGGGAHLQKAFNHCRHGELVNTSSLSSHSLGLPFYTDLRSVEIKYIVDTCLGTNK